MNRERSGKAFEAAREVIPGGVNSPVRAFRAVGGKPIFVKQGQGAWIEDVDGNRYVDYVCSWGPLILGHAHPEVIKALRERIGKGTSFGIPTELETELAGKVGVTRQTIGLIEAGKYNPTLKLCLMIAQVTGKRLDDLFWIKGEK